MEKLGNKYENCHPNNVGEIYTINEQNKWKNIVTQIFLNNNRLTGYRRERE